LISSFNFLQFIADKQILEKELNEKEEIISNLKQEKKHFEQITSIHESSLDIVNTLLWGLISSLFSVMNYSGEDSTKFGLKMLIIFTFMTYVGVKFSRVPFKISTKLIQIILGRHHSSEIVNKSVLWGASAGVGIAIFDKVVFGFFLNLPTFNANFLTRVSSSMNQSILEEIGVRFFLISMLTKIILNILKFSKFVIENEKQFQLFQIQVSKFLINLLKKQENLMLLSSILSFILFSFYKIPIQFSILSLSNEMTFFISFISILRVLLLNGLIHGLFSRMIFTDENLELVILSRFFIGFILYGLGSWGQI
jgi:hypothetical protein